jgi:hypothetical protein
MRRVRTWVVVSVVAAGASLFGSSVAAAQGSATDQAGDERGVPTRSLWTGAQIGVFAPYGGLYSGRDFVTTGFQQLASPGPAMQVDLGGRIARHFTVYGFWEYTSLGRGSSATWTEARGGQTSANTNAVGLAARWMSNPGGFGFIVDVGLGYRWFAARWSDGTSMDLGGLGDLRLGLGADVSFSSTVAVSLMVALYTGAFTDRTLAGQSVGQFESSYAATALSVGVHLDLFGG